MNNLRILAVRVSIQDNINATTPGSGDDAVLTAKVDSHNAGAHGVGLCGRETLRAARLTYVSPYLGGTSRAAGIQK